MKWYVGCSGFSYKEWKNVFYPPRLPQREWFSYYSSRFSTLELNVTFYRFPTHKLLQNWYVKSPGNFSFSVKAPKLITHYKKLKDCEDLLKDFYSVCREALKEKLGPLLFQFPPGFVYSDDLLQRVIENMDPSFINVVEFRDKSWWNDKVFTELNSRNIVFCGISYPGLPEDAIVTNEIAYYRFHGIPKLYYSSYDTATLQKIADSLLKQKDLKKVYCYFNNTAAVSAIDNAVWLEEYVGNRR